MAHCASFWPTCLLVFVEMMTNDSGTDYIELIIIDSLF